MAKAQVKAVALSAEAKADNAAFLKRCRKAFLAKLDGFGVHETDIIIAAMRKSRNGTAVGYYGRMSQFYSRLRIVVDVAYIRAYYESSSLAEEEVMMTIAHEYGHAMAEAIAHLASLGDPDATFTVPDWKSEFGGDEEAFAEDFARFCITYDSLHEPFWDAYIKCYAADFKRLFLTPPTDAAMAA